VPVVLDRDTVIRQILDAAPVDDALGWVLATFDGLSRKSVLNAYRHILQSNDLRVSFGPKARRYQYGDRFFAAHPVRVNRADTNHTTSE
jgi:hypothetical protein